MATPTPVAIIGIGCRFPGGISDPDNFWDLLAEGRNCWTPTPTSRFNEAGFLSQHEDDRASYNHAGGHFLSHDISTFDAPFFNIAAHEAAAIDPQQRFMLETTYEALENAGIPLSKIRGSQTAVFVSMFTRDYDRILYRDPEDIPKYHLTGSGEAIMSNRISYTFDLKGPSMTLDTGCSGSLVALHQACQSVRSGESSMAIAGGVNLILDPDHMITMSNMHMLNHQGRSFAFDERGSGYGRGEGCATIIVKKLDDAVAAGDPIRAVLLSTGVNQDGKTNGITLPSATAQAALQRSLHANLTIRPEDIDYVEAHGTGTVAGDRAEIEAIASVFCASRRRPLFVGSVKSNIGHLEGCSGLAGLIKSVLVLQRQALPPNSDFKRPKPGLLLHERQIHIPTQLEKLVDGKIRYVAVNSFGYGGTNGHAILARTQTFHQQLEIQVNGSTPKITGNVAEDASSEATNRTRLFLVSARSKPSLISNVNRLNHWLQNQASEFPLRDLEYTLCKRRSAFEWRWSCVASRQEDLLRIMEDEGMEKRIAQSSSKNCVVFLFTGQGAQWHAMGRELFQNYHVYRESLQQSQKLINSFGAPWSLTDELTKDRTTSQLGISDYAQPATTAVQIALVDLLNSVNIRPRFVIGHSSGEIAAAYAAGSLGRESAMKVAYYRGLASAKSNVKGGVKQAMLAVGLGIDDVNAYIPPNTDVCIACVNSPQSTTLSGSETHVDLVKEELEAQSIFCRKLKVDIAYHSKHMQPVSGDYLRMLGDLDHKQASDTVTFVSSVTATSKSDGFGPTYWSENLTEQVKYHQAVSTLLHSWPENEHQNVAFVEIGPHASLQGPTQQIIRHEYDSKTPPYFAALHRERRADKTLLTLLGNLFSQGIDVELGPVLGEDGAKVLDNLPTYAWDHSNSYWHESRMSRNHRLRKYPSHDLLGTLIPSSTSLEPRWRYLVGINRQPWLQHHVINHIVVFPGSGYVCMVMEAMRQLCGVDDSSGEAYECTFREVVFSKALIIPSAPATLEMQLSINTPTENDSSAAWHTFKITALGLDNAWSQHCVGFVSLEPRKTFKQDHATSALQKAPTSANTKASCAPSSSDNRRNLTKPDLYKLLTSNGNAYGPSFSCTDGASLSETGGATSMTRVPDIASSMPGKRMRPHLMHPTTLDALLHPCIALYYEHNRQDAVVPVKIGEMVVSSLAASEPGSMFMVTSKLESAGPRKAFAEVSGYNPTPESDGIFSIRIADLELHGLGLFPQTPLDARQISHRIQWDAFDVAQLNAQDSSLPLQITLVVDEDWQTKYQTAVMQDLTHAFDKFTWGVTLVSWASLEPENAITYVVLENSSHTVLTHNSERHFSKVKRLLRNVHRLLWITLEDGQSIYDPRKALTTGLIRTAHAENPHLTCVTLDVQDVLDEADESFSQVVRGILGSSFTSPPSASSKIERELIYRNRQLLVPRIRPFQDLNEWMATLTGKPDTEHRHFKQPNRTVRLLSRQQSMSKQPTFYEEILEADSVDPHAVVIDVETFGVNDGNGLVSQEDLELSATLSECSGRVQTVGSGVHRLRVGQRVCAWGRWTYASRLHVNAADVCALPSSISCERGAAMVIDFATAVHCLVHVGRVQKGHTVLVNGAARSAGRAVLTVAMWLGANIIANTDSSEEQSAIMQQYQLQQGLVLTGQAETIDRSVRELTAGEGVDVVVDCSLQYPFEGNVGFLKAYGTFVRVEGPFQSIQNRQRPPLLPSNTSYTSFNIFGYYAARPGHMHQLVARAVSLVEKHQSSLITAVEALPIEDMDEALRKANSPIYTSKVVLRAGNDSLVRMVRPRSDLLQLGCNATYVVAGGLGDIGQRLCHLMVERGAKHIVILSRRDTFSETEVQLRQRLVAMSPDFKLYCKRCDISNTQDVADLAKTIADMNVPAVRGIIQTTVVLRDRTLETMTYEDFQIPLRSKVQGTLNLDQAFASPALNFFLVLSSTIGVIGSRGQANYAAANTFLDAFATSRTQAQTRYVSLNLGLIQDADINNNSVVENLTKQGLTPLQPQEVRGLLEYAMSPRTVANGCHHIISGFDRASLARASIPNATTQHPLFSQIHPDVEQQSVNEGKTLSFMDQVKELKSSPEIHKLATDLMARKIGEIVAFTGAHVSISTPLTDIGLDSLVVMELRNWLSQEMHASMTAAEIFDQASIRSLAKTAVARSDLVHKADARDIAYHKTDPNRILADSQRVGAGDANDVEDSRELPIQPFPNLTSSLEQLWRSRQTFMSIDEQARFRRVIADFASDHGPGAELQRRLNHHARLSATDNWQGGLYAEKIYLERRDPIYPNTIFWTGHLITEGSPYSQAKKAAVLSMAAFTFKQRFEAGDIESDRLNEEVLCTDTWNWLFNCCREPRKGNDCIRRYPGNNHAAALCNGHIFKVPLDRGSKGSFRSPLTELEATFEAILAASSKEVLAAPTLTSEDRDTWAQLREQIISVNELNAETIRMVESAAFVVCLDDANPEHASQRCNQFFLGSPTNRWADKNLQFVVCKNGVSAMICEHSMLDGLSVRRLNQYITASILEHAPGSVTPTANGHLHQPAPDEYSITISENIQARIPQISRDFGTSYAPVELTHHDLNNLGGVAFRSQKISPRVGFQLVIQLACRIWYGYNPASWETVSMARFRKGRVDWIQTVSPEMAEFCAAAVVPRDAQEIRDLSERRRLMFEAATTFTSNMSRIARGHGFKAHLHALWGLLRDNEAIPEFFTDPQWIATSVSSMKLVKTDCVQDMQMQETCFLMPKPECIYIHFEPQPNGCKFFVQTWPGLSANFCEALDKAAELVKVILAAPQ